MKRIIGTAFAALIVMQMGCGDEATKTYSFTGEWLFSDLSGVCSVNLPESVGGQTLEFSTIRVSVYKNESEMENEKEPITTESVDCSEGFFVVEDLGRGSYYVTVEAIAEDPVDEPEDDAGVDTSDSSEPQLRAYYLGEDTVVLPTSSDEPIGFDMNINKGTIQVAWGFERGTCGEDWNKVSKVNVELKGTSPKNNKSTGKIACSTKEKQSYLFKDLPWDTYTITVTGYASDNTESHTGSYDEPIETIPGTDLTGKDSVYVELLPIE